MNKKEKMNSPAYSALLILAAFIWGSAFVAQSVGMDYIGPFTFGAVRNTIGFLVLIPVAYVSRRMYARSVRRSLGDGQISRLMKNAGESPDNQASQTTAGIKKIRKKLSRINKRTYIAGLICGVILCTASSFQQCGIVYTTVGKSGFITAMYIVIVPVLGIFLKKKTTWRTWVSVVLSVTGLYLLCIKAGDLSLGYGDLLMLACAFLFAIHILVVDHFMTVSISVRSGGSDGVTAGTGDADNASSHELPAVLEDHVDGVTLSCIQFGVTALIQIVAMFIFEEPVVDAILDAAPSILYAGVLSSGVAFTLQVITQRHLTPVVASLIMSMESVFSVLSGWVVLGERMSVRETIGCVLMFTAIVLAQLPGRRQTEGETMSG